MRYYQRKTRKIDTKNFAVVNDSKAIFGYFDTEEKAQGYISRWAEKGKALSCIPSKDATRAFGYWQIMWNSGCH